MPSTLPRSNNHRLALMPCGISFASSFLQLSIDPRENRGEEFMTQLNLFPPPASPTKTLSDEVRREARVLQPSAIIRAEVGGYLGIFK